jgi:hypothetical protein
MPVQFFPSPKDPSRKTPATPDERVETVNEGWAEKWFKYVTPETWETNNYPLEMFANDPGRAEQVRQQVEAAALPVKIRYLCEFMASDHTAELSNLKVPLLALRPGFNERVLADPANGWYKTSFLDAWDVFSGSPLMQLQMIPNARALIMEDQPKLADDAISRFIGHISKAKAEQVQ